MIKKSLLLILIISIILTGCTAAYRPEQTQVPVNDNNVGAVVIISNFAFTPNDLKVNQGTTVVWKNNDDVAHTVSIEGLVQSPVLNKGDEFSFTFNEKGEFKYSCGIHPSMKGKVEVK